MNVEYQKFRYFIGVAMERRWNYADRGKVNARRETCPSATVSTTNLTRTGRGIKPGPLQ